MSSSSSISSREKLLMSLMRLFSSSSCTILFLFFLKGHLWELYIFLGGGFLSPPPLEILLITFLDGRDTRALLRGVEVLGVIVGYLELFSLGPFPLCLYNSLVLSTISKSPTKWVGFPRLLSSSSPRTVWINELLNQLLTYFTQRFH